jgi:hypothetical protein
MPLPENIQQPRATSMSSAGFEPKIPATEWPLTHALDRTATWIGWINLLMLITGKGCIIYYLNIIHVNVSLRVFIPLCM